MSRTYRKFDNQRYGDYKGWRRRVEGRPDSDPLVTHDGISQTSYSQREKENERIARRHTDKRVVRSWDDEE